jgi:hypothetical protein
MSALKRVWLALLIAATAVACTKILMDAWKSAEAERLNTNQVTTIIRNPPDYSFLHSTRPISDRYGQLSDRQKAVERELDNLTLNRPAEPPSGAFSFPTSKPPDRQTTSTDLAAVDTRIRQLEAEDKQLREQAAAELLTNCRQRMMRRGIVLGNATCTDLDDIVRNLATGTYSFNRPKTLKLGEEFSLRLILQTNEGQNSNFDGAPGSIERVDNRPFAQSLEATLTGQDFGISPGGPQARTATTAHAVEWNWVLTPTSSGMKTITIEVAANIFIGTDRQRVQIDSLRETIAVQVTIFQRVKTYLASFSGVVVATAALVTPLAAIFGFFPVVRKFLASALSGLRRRRLKRR